MDGEVINESSEEILLEYRGNDAEALDVDVEKGKVYEARISIEMDMFYYDGDGRTHISHAIRVTLLEEREEHIYYKLTDFMRDWETAGPICKCIGDEDECDK